MAEAGNLPAGPLTGWYGAQQLQAQTEQMQATAGISQLQLSKLQETASLGKDAAAAAQAAGKAGDSAWSLNKAASLAAERGDLTLSATFQEEANKLQKSSMDQRKEALDLKVRENASKADDLTQALSSRDNAIEATKAELEREKNNTDPQVRAQQAKKMQVLEALQREAQTDMPWEVSPIKKEVEKYRDSLEPEQARAKAAKLALDKQKEEDRVRLKEIDQQERQLRVSQIAANRAAGSDYKEHERVFKIDNRIASVKEQLTEKLDKLNQEREKLAARGEKETTVVTHMFKPDEITKNPSYQKLDDLEARYTKEHDEDLARLNRERSGDYSIPKKPTKPEDTITGKGSLKDSKDFGKPEVISTPKGDLPLDRINKDVETALTTPGVNKEAILARYKQITGKDYGASTSSVKTSIETPALGLVGALDLAKVYSENKNIPVEDKKQLEEDWMKNYLKSPDSSYKFKSDKDIYSDVSLKGFVEVYLGVGGFERWASTLSKTDKFVFGAWRELVTKGLMSELEYRTAVRKKIYETKPAEKKTSYEASY